MQSRDKIAYLGALSLLMSLAELFVPRPLPFFRLGLANIPLLLGLTMDVGPYMALLLVKAIGNSYVSGTIFSPFALMSLAQTFASGMAMYGAGRLGERISIYSVSLLGAAVSSAVQIAVAALYAGRGVTAFLPLMLAVALPSSLLVAYIAKRIRLPEAVPVEDGNSAGGRRNTIPIAAMAITVGSSLMLDSIPLLLAALMASLCFQRATGRRIRLMPHIWTMAFMVLSMSQLFHALNLRSLEHSLFRAGPFKNRWLILTVLFGIVLQVIVCELPAAQLLLGTVHLDGMSWAVVFVLSASVIAINEFAKLFHSAR